VITCRVYRDGELERETPFSPEVVAAARDRDHRLWVDVVDPTDPELETIRTTLGLHELAVEDSRRWGQRAKVEFYGDHLFLVAHGMDLDERDELVDREVHLFAGAGLYVVTVRREPRFAFGKVDGRIVTARELSSEGIGFLLYVLLDEIVDGYLDTVERLEDIGDDIEDAVAAEQDGRTSGTDEDLARRIFVVRRQVVRLRRLAAPMRETIDLILETSSLSTPTLVPYYRDVLDHVIRMLELADNVRDLLTSARELQLAQASNRLNVVMKKLSAWAAIILIPTLIAGIYGMNFKELPETRWAFGYPFALGLMAASAFLLYLIFRRREWL
jgi:magnesium transporter